MLRVLKKNLPASLKHKIREWLLAELNLSQPDQSELSIAQGWEQYASNYANNEGTYLGDEWNNPEQIGIDVPADQIVPYLDEQVFTPFLENCEVLLEIGPGGGRFTQILLPKCRKLIAADTSPTMLKLLQERLAHYPNLEYMLLDGQGLSSIPDQSIDAAFSYGVFVHLQHWDIYNYLAELHRVLKPKGKAIIQHSNTFSEPGWQLFLSEVPESLNKPKLPGTFTVMTPEIMKEFAQRAGLHVVECLTNVVQRDCISLIRAPAR